MKMPRMPRQLSLSLLIIVTVALSFALAGLRQAQGQGGQNNVATVSAASFTAELSPEGIAAAFGTKLATKVEIATTLPLPTILAGTTVKVNGQFAPLFFVSPTQINYLIPTGSPNGNLPVIVTSGDGTISTGTVQVNDVAPAIFTASATGAGLPAAVILRDRAGVQSTEPVGVFDQTQNKFVARPIDPGPAGDRIFLILYLCGVRKAAPGATKVVIAGNELDPAFVGAAPDFTGLDQINVELPRYLGGRGRVGLQVRAADRTSNLTEIEMGGPDIRSATITTVNSSALTAVAGQTINFTVRVAASSQNAGVPAGNVMLLDNGVMIGRQPLDGTGQAVFNSAFATTGSRTMTANFEGRTNFKDSTGALIGTQIINKAQSTITVTSSDNPANRDQSVTLTAEVRPAPPSTMTPTGVIQFKADNAALGSPLTLINGRASLAVSTLALGARTITAEYYGDPNFNPSASAAFQQVINTPVLQVGGIVAPPPVFASDEITINGSGFTTNPADHEVQITDDNGNVTNPQVIRAAAGQLVVRVPFGAVSGRVKVIAQGSESAAPDRLELGTSVSGFVQMFKDGARTPVAGLPIALTEPTGRNIPATTNADGSFLLKGATALQSPAFSRIAIGAQAIDGINYPAQVRRITPLAGRDNQYSGDGGLANIIEIKPNGTTTTAIIAENMPINERLSVAAAPLAGNPEEIAGIITSGQVTFDTNNSTISFPPGSYNNLTLTVLDPRRTYANLPVGRFSSTIAQITPFGATLTPGGKLTFPNSDGIPSGTPVRVFRFDQTTTSQTVGQVIDLGAATISADGTKIETAANAVTQTSYYFVSRQWPTATVIGKVLDANGRALRRAVVNARGQAVFTDSFGGFVLPGVPVITPDGTNDQVTIEISFVRADGSIARSQRTITGLKAGETRQINEDFVLPRAETNRAPQIFAPSSLVLKEGEARDFSFIAVDPDGQPVNVTVTGAPFATIIAGNNNGYTLRLTPGANTANNYTLIIKATDSTGLSAMQTIALIVQRSSNNRPMANYLSVTTNEDTPVGIALTATNPAGGALTYNIVSNPAHGILSGAVPNLLYTPALNYNGADSFNFKVVSSSGESNVATVFIGINPVNDAPVLTISTASSLSVNAGETVKIDVTATDADAGQTLNFTATGLPPGASFVPSATSAQFRWTPIFAQAGPYTVNFTVSDNGAPIRSESKAVTVNVDAKWAKTSGPEGGAIISFLNFGGALYVGTSGGGIYRSTNNGQTWVGSRNGLAGKALTVNAMATSGNSILAGTFDGVYRSNDNGQSWVRASNGFPSGNIPVFALLVKDGILFAGTGDLFGNGRGMFRSMDNGQNWLEINNGLNTRNVTALARIGDTIFASTGHLNDFFGSGGLYRSNNNGDNWLPSANGLSIFGTVPIVTTILATNNAFFAATAVGLYRSVNNGQNWSQLGSGLPDSSFAPVTSLAASGNTLFAGTFSEGIFRSTDNGTYWTPASNGLEGYALNILRLLATDTGNLFAGTGDFFGRGGGLYRSTDNAANWQLTRSGITASFAQVLLQTSNGLFAGTAESGINRSTDNGQSWTPVNNGLVGDALVVYALATQGGSIFAGTLGDGVYRSTNNGQSWMKTSNGLPAQAQVYALLSAGNMLFAGTAGFGVYRSMDGGQSWTRISDGLAGNALYVSALQPISSGSSGLGNIILAATDDGIYRLADNGQSWTRSSTGLSGNGLFVRALLPANNNLFAGTLGGGVYRSIDNGQTWVQANTGITGDALNVLTLLALGDSIYIGTASLNVGGESVFRSTDNGQSWQPFRSAFTQESVYSLVTDGQQIFAATFGDGVFRLANNVQSWAASNANLSNRFVNTVAVSGSTLLTGTLGSGVFRSTNQGQSWQAPSIGLPQNANVQALAVSGNNIFAGLYAGGVYRSTNDGASWIFSGLANQNINVLTVGGNGIVFAGTDAGAFRSNDQGQSWQPANLSNRHVVSFAFNGNKLWAGTYGGGIYASTDNGANWTLTGSSGNGLGNLYVTALTLGTDGTALFAGTDGGGIYRSTNGGGSWTAVNNDLPPTLNVYAFAVSGTKLYAGSIYGVFLSEDNGAKWKQINAGLLDIYVTSLAVNGNSLIAGTRVGGVFISQIP